MDIITRRRTAQGAEEGTAAIAHTAKQPRRASEHQALRQVAARLAQQFPDLSADEIDRAVNGHYATFEHSPIRDFVPMLVERASRQQLADDRANRRR